MTRLLEVDDLGVSRFGTRKLRDVSFSVDDGEIVAILGPNGAGKTTLMRALTRLTPVSSGTVHWLGRPLPTKPHLVARAGLVLTPQDQPVFPDLTVREHLELAARVASAGSVTEQAIDLFPDLGKMLGQMGGALSGGQRQMLSIAQSLGLDPKLLMLDEPSSGLAPKAVMAVFAALARVAQTGVAVLVVEQNAAQTLAFARTALVLEHGTIALRGRASDLAVDPHVKRAYLGL